MTLWTDSAGLAFPENVPETFVSRFGAHPCTETTAMFRAVPPTPQGQRVARFMRRLVTSRSCFHVEDKIGGIVLVRTKSFFFNHVM